MQHTVVDGLAIFEGDIVLGLDDDLRRKTSDLHEARAQEMRGVESKARSGDAVDVAVPAIVVPAEAVVVSRQSKRWPEGIVHYQIDASLTPAHDNARATQAIALFSRVRSVKAFSRVWLAFGSHE